MPTPEDHRIAGNLQVIRQYLANAFPGCIMTDDRPSPPTHHSFTMTERATGTRYKLKVAWGKLSDSGNVPEKTMLRLCGDNVAEQMRAAKGEYFYWAG